MGTNGWTLKKNDFYEIFALICYQFSQMPFQYLPTELYEIIVSPTAGDEDVTDMCGLDERSSRLAPGGCEAEAFLPNIGWGVHLADSFLHLAPALSLPTGCTPGRVHIQAADSQATRPSSARQTQGPQHG